MLIEKTHTHSDIRAAGEAEARDAGIDGERQGDNHSWPERDIYLAVASLIVN